MILNISLKSLLCKSICNYVIPDIMYDYFGHDVIARFLREREVVHFQRFGEALRMITE